MLKILFWPFSLAGWLMETVLSFAGNLVVFLIGLALMVVGASLCGTLVLAVVGVPLFLAGGGLIVKGLF